MQNNVLFKRYEVYTHKNKTLASCSLQEYPGFSNNFLRNYSSEQSVIKEQQNKQLTLNT